MELSKSKEPAIELLKKVPTNNQNIYTELTKAL